MNTPEPQHEPIDVPPGYRLYVVTRVKPYETEGVSSLDIEFDNGRAMALGVDHLRAKGITALHVGDKLLLKGGEVGGNSPLEDIKLVS